MKIMLTSFGLGHEYLPAAPVIPPVFRRLPPLNMRLIAGPFEPEYSLLVLCDKLILDELSFERLNEPSSPVFTTIAETIKILHGEGFVELTDYSATLRNNSDLLRRMTDSDITNGRWQNALAESSLIWHDYVDKVNPNLRLKNLPSIEMPRAPRGNIMHYAPHGYTGDKRALERQTMYNYANAEYFTRPDITELIAAYLIYINANLILANEMGTALHDWEDLLPFYRQKFLGVGKSAPPGSAQAEAARQLFDIALPELAIDSPQQLLRILKHRHIEELRALIDAASKGEVEFDVDFARNAFREVFGIERKAAKGRRIIGYVTMPIGFVPLVGNFAQALLQEAAGTLLERRLRKPYRWLYMLSDLAQRPAGHALPKSP